MPLIVNFWGKYRVNIDRLKPHELILGHGNHRLGVHEGCGGTVQVSFDSTELQNRAFCGNMETCGFREALFLPELDTPVKIEAEHPDEE